MAGLEDLENRHEQEVLTGVEFGWSLTVGLGRRCPVAADLSLSPSQAHLSLKRTGTRPSAAARFAWKK